MLELALRYFISIEVIKKREINPGPKDTKL